MTASAMTILIGSTLATFGVAVATIISAVIGVGVAYLVFTIGWKRLFFDKSLMIGGYYVRNTPFKGYHRFRSRDWNMKHMP